RARRPARRDAGGAVRRSVGSAEPDRARQRRRQTGIEPALVRDREGRFPARHDEEHGRVVEEARVHSRVPPERRRTHLAELARLPVGVRADALPAAGATAHVSEAVTLRYCDREGGNTADLPSTARILFGKIFSCIRLRQPAFVRIHESRTRAPTRTSCRAPLGPNSPVASVVWDFPNTHATEVAVLPA